ncbi:DUF4157 domain-containing protein [Jannaschia sp. R86511]|uniref:eCIS core domain-containing protein n=1 Tax=Jannaschia sp. R86511 TaxID=3093853 RepID=UPI0036D2CAFA
MSARPHPHPSADGPVPECAGRRIRARRGQGRRLPDGLLAALERAYRADLRQIRLHEDAEADSLARTLDADAFTSGTDIYLRAGAPRPDSDAGVELLAHEVAHVLQQSADPQQSTDRPDPVEPEGWLRAEDEAVAAARAFTAETLPAGTRRHRAARPADAGPVVVQRHSSWEHRMLGDVRTADFAAIAAGGEGRKDYLRRVRDFLLLWSTDPDVSAASITERFPEIRPLTLRVSGLVVTYGELNTLADYLASPAELDSMPKNLLLPLLQQVRQEGFAWVSWVLEDQWLDKDLVFGGFVGSVADTTGSDTADALWETYRLDGFTTTFGPRGINAYSSLLARNACHFAPHSWYRWEQFYLQARAFAVQAAHATGHRKDRLTNLAWINHGYADHFLHDSFAAGHLVNKTLVMQWYLDWVGTFSSVPDWDLLQFMTLAHQPDLAGRPLYSAFHDPNRRGEVRDPQTASEHWSLARRTAVSGVRADGSPLGSSYKRWLAFLSVGVVQLASNTVHDHFNSSSLWVSSEDHPQAFQLYGDNTMIKGGDGYQVASATAQLSQRSITELLAGGTTTVTASDIARRFPSRVHDAGSPAVSQSLEEWAYGYQQQAGAVFDGVKNRLVGFLRTRLAPITIDSTGGWRWAGVEGEALDVAVGADGVAWALDADRLDAQGNGRVRYRDQLTRARWVDADGAGVRIAADGDGGAWLVNAAGDSFYTPKQKVAWQKGKRAVVSGVEGLVDIAAGTDGSVWALAKAPVPGGHQLMRCVQGTGSHSWQPVAGGATAVSVGPDGLPWVVNEAGSVLRLVPGNGPDPAVGDGATWVDATPAGRKATDIGVGTGSRTCVWITTGTGVMVWNGRGADRPATGTRLELDWEDMGGVAQRVAAGGPDNRPWVLNQHDTYLLIPGQTATAEFSTGDAGKVQGTARATGGSLFQGEQVAVNGSTDLSGVVVGNSGARVYSIRLDRSALVGFNYTLFIDGQGPTGVGSGSLYLFFEDEGGFVERKQFWLHDRHTLTDDYNGAKAGIRRISWSPDIDDPARPH